MIELKKILQKNNCFSWKMKAMFVVVFFISSFCISQIQYSIKQVSIFTKKNGLTLIGSAGVFPKKNEFNKDIIESKKLQTSKKEKVDDVFSKENIKEKKKFRFVNNVRYQFEEKSNVYFGINNYDQKKSVQTTKEQNKNNKANSIKILYSQIHYSDISFTVKIDIQYDYCNYHFLGYQPPPIV